MISLLIALSKYRVDLLLQLNICKVVGKSRTTVALVGVGAVYVKSLSRNLGVGKGFTVRLVLINENDHYFTFKTHLNTVRLSESKSN